MFQTFDSPASPTQGPARLAALRAALTKAGLAGYLIPRADAHQGEYVAARDERLQWLTGFTGSAGFCIVLPQTAGVFIDGRYRTQVKLQVDLAHFTPVPWPEIKPGPWILENLTAGVIGFDPWLHTADEIEKLQSALTGSNITLRATDNLVDAIWPDQPAAPLGKVFVHPDKLAGETATAKRARLAASLDAAGQEAAVLTLPDSICWLLNIRGADVPKNPVVQALEGFRRATNALHDISFDTICGSGPNGAIMHYRVTDESNRAIHQNELLLVDSGAQYRDGTTDITRTVAVGYPGEEARASYTRVLQGVIAISRARWPRGLAGRDLDPLARQALWQAGQDFNHGTGHGVGAFLSVHEGPQRLSRISEVPLEPGMILSNEPGYYREGAFGIRLENLIVVQVAESIGDHRDQLAFETLTFAPFDRRLIDADQLSAGDRAWLNAYHAQVLALLSPRLSDFALSWAHQGRKATSPLASR